MSNRKLILTLLVMFAGINGIASFNRPLPMETHLENESHEEDEDWYIVQKSVRIVNLSRGESNRGDIYRNSINGRWAILPNPGKNEMMYYIEESDRPKYKYMFVYGDFATSNRKWYFNSEKIKKLPILYDHEFVKLIKAVSGSHSSYFRLYRSVVDKSLTIKTDDPVFGCIVYKSDADGYQYMFTLSGLTWYFNITPRYKFNKQ